MSMGGYPTECVVDTHTTRPPVPPRLTRGRQRTGVAQTLLFLLVSLALCGMAIEACFIYRLYRPGSATSASSSKLIAGPVATSPPKPLVIPPSKPVAHLTDGQDVVHGEKIMAWSMDASPLLYEMNYEDKCLIIQMEGYYYVYSKVSFLDHGVFEHYVNWRTERYLGGRITLLKSKSYSDESSEMRSNSYLGGVFHLRKGDALFVEVNHTSHIARHNSYENVFGAYMI